MTFSPCCKWALIESEGEDGVQEEEGCWGWGGGIEGERGREGRLGANGGLGGNHSSENGSAVKEGPDCIGTACESEQHAQPNQSDIRKKCSYQPVMAHLTITQAQNCSI